MLATAARQRTGLIPASQEDVAGWPDLGENRRNLTVPADRWGPGWRTRAVAASRFVGNPRRVAGLCFCGWGVALIGRSGSLNELQTIAGYDGGHA